MRISMEIFRLHTATLEFEFIVLESRLDIRFFTWSFGVFLFIYSFSYRTIAFFSPTFRTCFKYIFHTLQQSSIFTPIDIIDITQHLHTP